jgi:hypothetical protein
MAVGEFDQRSKILLFLARDRDPSAARNRQRNHPSRRDHPRPVFRRLSKDGKQPARTVHSEGREDPDGRKNRSETLRRADAVAENLECRNEEQKEDRSGESVAGREMKSKDDVTIEGEAGEREREQPQGK